MKIFCIPNPSMVLLLMLSFVLGPNPALRAQAPAEPAPAENAAAAAKAEPAKPESEKPKVETPAPEQVPAAPAVETPKAAATIPVEAEKKIESAEPVPTAPDDKAGSDAMTDKPENPKKHHQHFEGSRVVYGGNSTLAAGEYADEVVSILGSSTSDGEVRKAVVSILGSSTSSGKVGDAVVSILGNTQVTGGTVGKAAVSILGNTRVTGGTVGDSAVSILGNTYVNGKVKRDVVAILGNVELGPDAEVGGHIVPIGGHVKRDSHASVQDQNLPKPWQQLDQFDLGGPGAWITDCLFKGRPLAFGANLMWAWWIALSFLGFYALVALIVPNGVNKCVQTFEERPGYSIVSALLTMLLTPMAFVLLVLTLFLLIGFLLIPLFSFGLFFASIFGKVVILAWLGRRVTRLFGAGPLGHPFFCVLIGGVIVLGLYTVPILGFIVYKLIGLIGLGVVLYTIVLMIKGRRPAPPASAPVVPASAQMIPPLPGEPAAAPAPTPPPVVSAMTLPRAGFWLRLAATLLDLILVAVVFGMLKKMLFGFGNVFPFWFALYHVIMWALKSTTIGGIICGLKVVRTDDRPLDWSVAIVRCLSAFLSFVVLGLGFLWVAFDDERQSWHDKIAGTTIVKVPKGTPLL